jgi:hypothetical protein
MGVNYGISPNWAKDTNEGRTHIATKGVYSNNLVFNLDFGTTGSYSGSGTSVADLTGSYTGTLNSGATFSATDQYGGIVLDGVDDTIRFGTIPLVSNVSVTNNFTIEQVFKPTSYQPGTYFGLTNSLMYKGTASTFNYATQVSSDTTVSFIKRTSPEGLQYSTFTVPSMLNQPSVLTFVVSNGTSGSGTVSCYLNGEFIQTQTITGTAIAAVADDPFRIGGDITANSQFKGTYYSCRIYNTNLSATDVKRNFNVIRKRFGI